MSGVGPAVPAVNSLDCTYSSASDLASAFCGAPATHHALIDADVEEDGGESSVLACAAHEPMVRALAFTVHEVSRDCAMPGSVCNWEPDGAGGIRSWCSFPDEDPVLMVSAAEPIAARGSVDLPALLMVTVPTLFAMAAAVFGPEIRWLVGYVATCIGLSLFAAALMAVGAVLVLVAHRCLLAAAYRCGAAHGEAVAVVAAGQRMQGER